MLRDDVLADLGIKRENLIEKKSIEVGNIFTLGTRFSEPIGLSFRDETGGTHPVLMGCYGIGPGRVMGTIAETLSDEKGLVWPESVAPFRIHLLSLGTDEKSAEVYQDLVSAGIEVLYDDRDFSAGQKFAESDLLGIPYRIIIGRRSIESGMAEVKYRADDKIDQVPFEGLTEYFLEK